MNNEDIEFLKNLQHEMNTQDTLCQADPRFWVVMQTVREYGINLDYGCDGIIITSHNDCELEIDANNMQDIYNWLIEDFDINCDYKDERIHIIEDDKDLYNYYEVLEYLDELGYDEFYTVNYRDKEQIVENTFFLTKKECEEHIKANYYHYNKPYSYCMTAWRSPQVEKLYKILQETDWEDYIIDNSNSIQQSMKQTDISQINNAKNNQFFEGWQPPYYFKTEHNNDVCDKCGCNPKNGGSGNCNCILGSLKIMS